MDLYFSESLYTSPITFQKLLITVGTKLKFGRNMAEVYLNGKRLYSNDNVPENEVFTGTQLTIFTVKNADLYKPPLDFETKVKALNHSQKQAFFDQNLGIPWNPGPEH